MPQRNKLSSSADPRVHPALDEGPCRSLRQRIFDRLERKRWRETGLPVIPNISYHGRLRREAAILACPESDHPRNWARHFMPESFISGSKKTVWRLKVWFGANHLFLKKPTFDYPLYLTTGESHVFTRCQQRRQIRKSCFSALPRDILDLIAGSSINSRKRPTMYQGIWKIVPTVRNTLLPQRYHSRKE